MKENKEWMRGTGENKSYRLAFHLMPPAGWMNDPNGLCDYNSLYHVFFQYSPDDVLGGLKCWGHYTSKNLLDWTYQGEPLKADSPWDRDGAYSGSALIEDGEMKVFYTGNVKEKGEFDYVQSGRGANVITVSSRDGITFSRKKLLLTNQDYPQDYTCHVRDPKVWKEKDRYYMLLGGRRRNDEGDLLLYSSLDQENWKYAGRFRASTPFGYMWECPDYFELEGKRFLLCCPQGLNALEDRYQNRHQSGYFPLLDMKELEGEHVVDPEEFTELDHGFDFYAPQTFEDRKGRRILIGWAGVPDMEQEYHNNPIIEEGWQHSMTVPRVLSVKEGRLRQLPAEELTELREEEVRFQSNEGIIDSAAFDAVVTFPEDALEEERGFRLGEDLKFLVKEGTARLELLNESGGGRTVRKTKIRHLLKIRLLKDTSMLELYINDGETVFTTRYFPKNPGQTKLTIIGKPDSTRIWKLRPMIPSES